MLRDLRLLLVSAAMLAGIAADQSAAQVILYDNTMVEPPFQFADVIGPRFDLNSEGLAQQFHTGLAPRLQSVGIQLQRVGSPSGTVSVDIWDDSGLNLPGARIASIGTFDVSALSESPQLVNFDGLSTVLDVQSSYFVVLDNTATDISSAENSYRFGMLGHESEAQNEGTNGAARVVVPVSTGNDIDWLPFADLLPCHPSGACPHYLRMSVHAAPVPEPTSLTILALAGCAGAVLLRRVRSRD